MVPVVCRVLTDSTFFQEERYFCLCVDGVLWTHMFYLVRKVKDKNTLALNGQTRSN